MKMLIRSISVLALLVSSQAFAASILWWDSTPSYGNQAPNSLRQEMSDYITDNTVHTSTYRGSETPGTLAAELATNTYDVIVFDATSGTPKFNDADLDAVRNHYATKSNVLLDGSLYIRSINFNATTNFPGTNDATGGLTINQINQLATRGGGIMIGTDHNCCQTDANQILNAIIPGAAFSGITNPSTDGVFYGSDLLNDVAAIAASDILDHWDTVPSQAIAETGDFVDANGNNITLYSQVDVANEPGGGERLSYISTSWEPGSGTTDVDDDTVGGTGDDDDDDDDDQPMGVPEPGSFALMALGLALVGLRRRRMS